MIRFRLVGDRELALDPAPHRSPPKMSGEINPDSGPGWLPQSYRTGTGRRLRARDEPLRLVGSRDGAIFWGLFFDTAQPARFVEYFVVESWLEHLRQHERGVLADLEVERHARSFHVGTAPPIVSHQVSVDAIDKLDAAFLARTAVDPPLQTDRA